MTPHYIDLSWQYRLYAFATYQDMKAAMAQLPHVKLAKAFSKVKPIEANHYAGSAGHGDYRNYLENSPTRNVKPNGLASLITALQVLYQVNGYSAKYILIARK
ncbi:hypothetical protein WG947_04515 [Pontibacter sp. H259]|uniref:hypothetical protein n=1 Tax=Pontibacter sp. H259 TaxID=3133421 RepID=UPI0030C01FD4